MIVVKNIHELKERLANARSTGKSIALVPTMGYFHEGHLALMKRARERCDLVVVSLFVNPTQFGPGEDFERYPRDEARDATLAQSVGVDVLFHPDAQEMYPDGFSTFVEVGGVSEGLCGRARPGHFRGVATVVTKLFNIVQPDVAIFGRKDFQQLRVIERLVEDLNINVEVDSLATVREPDGLAMSSRNAYLSQEERNAALSLSRALNTVAESISSGERSVEKLQGEAESVLRAESLVNVEYFEILDADSLSSIDVIAGKTLIAVAAKVGKTRLIDNVLVRPPFASD